MPVTFGEPITWAHDAVQRLCDYLTTNGIACPVFVSMFSDKDLFAHWTHDQFVALSPWGHWQTDQAAQRGGGRETFLTGGIVRVRCFTRYNVDFAYADTAAVSSAAPGYTLPQSVLAVLEQLPVLKSGDPTKSILTQPARVVGIDFGQRYYEQGQGVTTLEAAIQCRLSLPAFTPLNPA